MQIFHKYYRVSFRNRKDIEYILANKPLSNEKTNKVKVKTNFFSNKTTVTLDDNYAHINSKLTPTFALLIPFSSLLVVIYLISQSVNLFFAESIGLLALVILTNYLMFVYLAQASHSNISSHIYSNLYYSSVEKQVTETINKE